MANRKKLYFDFTLTSVPTQNVLAGGKRLRMRCTAGAAALSGSAINPRNGDFMESLPALLGSSPTARKALSEVQIMLHASTLATAASPAPEGVGIRLNAFFANADGSAAISFLSVNDAAVAAKAGNSAIFSRNFNVILVASAVGTVAATATIRGVLVAQREHSMDV